MYCSKCGSQNLNGERFCKNCGSLLENIQPQQSVNNMNSQFQQPMNQPQMYNQQYTNNNGNLDPNYINQAVNPNMQKWAILSVVVPIAAMVWFWFIGLTLYLGIIIAAAGFSFAEKGKMANKKLAIIGKILNGIFLAVVIVVFSINIISNFMG